MLGLTFKPNTDDMRDSPSLSILPRPAGAGATVRAFDPEGMDEAAQAAAGPRLLRRRLRDDARAPTRGHLTEWNEFRALDFERIKAALRTPVMVDLRNIYSPRKWPRPASPTAASAGPTDEPGDEPVAANPAGLRAIA